VTILVFSPWIIVYLFFFLDTILPPNMPKTINGRNALLQRPVPGWDTSPVSLSGSLACVSTWTGASCSAVGALAISQLSFCLEPINSLLGNPETELTA
jgi:hypothetical protein